MKRRRAILKVIALLAAGAALNVAVAWGCVVRSEHRSMSNRLNDPPMLLAHAPVSTVSRDLGVVQTLRCWRTHGGYSWGVPTELVTQTEFEERLPYWSALRSGRYAEDICEHLKIRLGAFRDSIGEEAAGWPTIAMWGVKGGSSNDARVNQLRLPLRNRTGDWGIFVPCEPIWPGFAINTVFYAGVLWMLSCGPFALRRILRRRRGQCAHCAYPIGQNERCTECGAPHAHHRRSRRS